MKYFVFAALSITALAVVSSGCGDAVTSEASCLEQITDGLGERGELSPECEEQSSADRGREFDEAWEKGEEEGQRKYEELKGGDPSEETQREKEEVERQLREEGF